MSVFDREIILSVCPALTKKRKLFLYKLPPRAGEWSKCLSGESQVYPVKQAAEY